MKFWKCLLLIGWLGISSMQTHAQSLELKSPHKARTLSIFIPGSGHIYAGERAKGIGLMVGSGAALIGGIILSDFESDFDYTCQSDNCFNLNSYNPNYTPLIVGGGIAAAIWLYALIDAPKAVERFNIRHGLASRFRLLPAPVINNGRIIPGVSIQINI